MCISNMSAGKTYEYDAFISYRHTPLDKMAADKLQRLLERYTPPKSAGMAPDRKKLHIFRDVTELPIGANLSDQLRRALERSRYLIVICSETTAQSPWCMEEIVYFKELHGGNTGRIITMVTEGNPIEVIPRELFSETRYETGPDGAERAVTVNVEPLAANVGGPSAGAVLRNLKKEFLRVAAPLLGKKFDELYNRRQRQTVRRAAIVALTVAAGLVMFTVYTLSMMLEIQKQKDQAEIHRDMAIEQSVLAEERRGEAEEQRKLAIEQRGIAEEQRNLALEQMAIADQQRNIALEQRGIAEEQRGLAEEQRGLAEEQKEIAEEQRGLAEEQKGIAEHQRGVAEGNLSYAQSLLLAGATDYASRLAEEGSANRAAAVLSEVYKNIDFKRQDSDVLATQFRDAALGAMFGDWTRPYASMDAGGGAFAMGFLSERHGAAVTADAILHFDARTGETVNTARASEPFVAGRVTERYAAAVTENGHVFLYDSFTRKTALSEDMVYAYHGESVISLYVSPDNGFVAVASSIAGRFESVPGSVYDVPGGSDETYGKLILTFIPCDFKTLKLDERESRVFTYKTDVDYGLETVSVTCEASPDGRFVAFFNQYERTAGETVFYRINSDFWVADLDAFRSGNMVAGFDAAVDGEHPFDYNIYYVTDSGLLVIDGSDRYEADEKRTQDNQRSIVYDSRKDALLINQNIAVEGGFGDDYSPLQTHCESALWREYMVYSIRGASGGSELKRYDINGGKFASLTYTLPERVYKTGFYEAGIDWILTNNDKIYYISYYGSVSELQMPGAVLKGVSHTGKTLLAAFGDGSLALYNLGPSLYTDGLDRADKMPSESGRTAVCYNSGRSLMFGYTGARSSGYEYGIWDVKTGKRLYSFPADEDEKMNINAEFTHVIAQKASYRSGYSYRVIEAANGKTVCHYDSPDPYVWFNDVHFGLRGDRAAWLFRSDIMRLETVDLTTGKVTSVLNLANKLPSDRYNEVYHDNGLMVFTGSSGYVYSISAGSVVMRANIEGADVDCRAVYISDSRNTLSRVELTPENAYKMLCSPNTPALTQTDRAAAGLSIFN